MVLGRRFTVQLASVINTVLQQLELELAVHVNNQNTFFHSQQELALSKYLHFHEDKAMREIKDLGDTLRGTLAQLRTSVAQAKQDFASEVNHTQANVAKVKSFTADMKETNKEVEALLNDAGSNFEPEPVTLPGVTSAPAPVVDKNGVTVNKAK